MALALRSYRARSAAVERLTREEERDRIVRVCGPITTSSSFARSTYGEEECERFLRPRGPDHYELVVRGLDVQLELLHDRAQLLLGICGVLASPDEPQAIDGEVLVHAGSISNAKVAPS